MFIDNKYTRLYYRIINNRLQNPIMLGYKERHHIVPKSLGGSNLKENTVHLTVREHFVCHRLLPKMTSGLDRQRMYHALVCFLKPLQKSRPDIVITSYVVAQAREESARFLSQTRKGKATRPAGEYRHSEETKRKQSASALGIVKRPKGYAHTEETKQKMSANRKGKNAGTPSWNKGITQECPYCKKIVGGTLNRWHGENCKMRLSSSLESS